MKRGKRITDPTSLNACARDVTRNIHKFISRILNNILREKEQLLTLTHEKYVHSGS